MTSQKISFEVYGDVNDMDFDPNEFTEIETMKEFEKLILDGAEDSATWGVRIIGDTIEKLWEKVQQAKASKSF